MGELIKCKVRDIKDSSGRWEVRLESNALPGIVQDVTGKQIRLRFSDGDYLAHTGIASIGGPSQYFWLNTHKNESGPIKDILIAHGYKPNDEIFLHPDKSVWTVVKIA